MLINIFITKFDGFIYFDVYRSDKAMCITSIIDKTAQKDMIKIRTFADLEDLSVAEMRDLWGELKKPYISPPAIMERIRADVLEHLQEIGRIDLVSVCLDHATYGEVAMYI